MASDTEYSIVVPFFNEERSVTPLYDLTKKVMDPLKSPYELIFINDGSTDRTASILEKIEKEDNAVIVVTLAARQGQTEALREGFARARGKIVVSMDGDLQNDPNDIPGLISELKKGYDFVCGWRHLRKDPLSKKIASRFGNFVQESAFKDHLHDISCTLRAYTKESAKNIPLKRRGAHRFIPYFLIMSGKRASEVKVNHLPRHHGKTKYGFSRSFRVAYDFLTLFFNRKSWM